MLVRHSAGVLGQPDRFGKEKIGHFVAPQSGLLCEEVELSNVGTSDLDQKTLSKKTTGDARSAIPNVALRHVCPPIHRG